MNQVADPLVEQQAQQEAIQIIGSIAEHRAGVEKAETWAARDFWRLTYLRNIRYDRDVTTHWLLPLRAFFSRHPWIAAFLGFR